MIPKNVRVILCMVMLGVVVYDLYIGHMAGALITGVFLVLCFYDILTGWCRKFKSGGSKPTYGHQQPDIKKMLDDD